MNRLADMNMACAQCGTTTQPSDHFCYRCGRALDGSSALVPYGTAIAPQAFYAPAGRTIVDTAKDFLRLFRPQDSEFVKLALNRIDEQDHWNDVFSTKLIELLDNIDGIRGDLRSRMRTIEESVQAESVLIDEAKKAADLSKKLADAERYFDGMREQLEAATTAYRGAQRLRAESQKILDEAKARFTRSGALLIESISRHQSASETLISATEKYQQSTENLASSSSAYENASSSLKSATSTLAGASERLRLAENTQQQASSLAHSAMQDSEKASSALVAARLLAESAAGRLALAEEKHLKAARLSGLTVRVAVLAVALSWTATGWFVWVASRMRAAFWIAVILSLVMTAAVVLVFRGAERET